jgi:hypothetical protein
MSDLITSFPNAAELHLNFIHLQIPSHTPKIISAAKILRLFQCKISDYEIYNLKKSFPQLEYLDLRGVEGLSDRSISEWARSCMSPITINVRKTAVTAEWCTHLHNCYPHISFMQ